MPKDPKRYPRLSCPNHFWGGSNRQIKLEFFMNNSYHDHFRGIGIAGMLFFLNQFTGISSLVVYMTSIFKVPFTAVYYWDEHVLEFRFLVKQLILGIISGIWFDPEPSVGPCYNRWRTLLVPVIFFSSDDQELWEWRQLVVLRLPSERATASTSTAGDIF